MAKQQSNNRIWRLLKQRVFFTVAVGDIGRTRTFAPAVGVILALVGGGLGLLGNLALKQAENGESVFGNAFTQLTSQQLSEYERKVAELEKINAFQKQQLGVFAQEVGILQARIERLDMMGDQLFTEELASGDVTYADMLPQGGPDLQTDQNEGASVMEVASQLLALNRQSAELDKRITSGLRLMEAQDLDQSFMPHRWPVVSEKSYVSSAFGWRIHPIKKTKRWHDGIDIAGPYNSPLVATADGIVTFSGYRFGYGIFVEIQHPENVITRYAHLNKTVVATGQRVKAGEVVGSVGSTGQSTGPHVHFEVSVSGQKVDPWPLIRDGREYARMLALSQNRSYP